MPLFTDTIPHSNRVIRDSKNRIFFNPKLENDVERRFQHEKSYPKANFFHISHFIIFIEITRF
jgi:hypothetical protein